MFPQLASVFHKVLGCVANWLHKVLLPNNSEATCLKSKKFFGQNFDKGDALVTILKQITKFFLVLGLSLKLRHRNTDGQKCPPLSALNSTK